METRGGSREVLTLQLGRYSNMIGAHYWNFQDELWNWAAENNSGHLPDPYDPTILFSAKGGTPAPRLLAWDTRDGLGGMHPAGTMVDRANTSGGHQQVLWGGHVSRHQQGEPVQPNAFQRFLADESGDTSNNYENGGSMSMDALAFNGTAMGGATYEGNFTGGQQSGNGSNINISTPSIEIGARVRRHPFGLDDSVTTWTDFLKTHVHKGSIQVLPFGDTFLGFDTFSSGTDTSVISSACRETYSDAMRLQLEDCDSIQRRACSV